MKLLLRQDGEFTEDKRSARKVLVSCGMMMVSWVGLWVYFLVGAAIFMAIDNPSRQEALSFLDAVYFTGVYVTSCGFGDIVPLSAGGRAFICLWSFFGTGLWLLFLVNFVTILVDLIYLVVSAHLLDRVRRFKRAFHFRKTEKPGHEDSTTSPITPTSSASIESSDTPRQDTTSNNIRGASIETDTTRQVGSSLRDSKRRRLTLSEKKADLSWYALLILNLVALIFYFIVHLVGAAVIYHLEPDLGNMSDLTSNSYGNTLYMTYITSQTICFGTDYNIKTSSGRAFFVVWHQFSLMSSTFLFVNVAMTLMRWCKRHFRSALDKYQTLARRRRTEARGNIGT